ncbi:hypothetical protein BLS_005126 [Venturia inaequalis]|uniref:Heterokaryon incompatibility domain-containing protein n=1 Tax=Venturia inaequalis TaxID=5025 RepID=A0A8H3YQZ4_VENIN|nr:hypothetical protein BLS_005126 [Venturia inaequalis]KAE9990690.1 hypothetical protein EG327_001085 [Venturia inaequalis]RDI82204.1 hypothetical protein Vi05172_g7904 [Venturia inaequalis]
MRLLDTKDLSFHEFIGTEIPHYAILSHRWEGEEVSYKEMMEDRSLIKGKAGYRKVCKAAEYARQNEKQQYIWIDTCCIDKSSSAELTEAINSMYQWYKDSAICYAYLSDVPKTKGDENISPYLCSSKWFTRGWTLQELLAPPDVQFLSSDWKFHCARTGWHASDAISRKTGIPQEVLQGRDFRPTDWSVAERMSWAAKRTTTVQEDMAYCLLGLFEVNMPLLYGEGQRAFFRLQEEITKHSNDYTIFLWRSVDKSTSAYRGMFSRHPSEFESSNYEDHDQLQSDQAPFLMTNAGVRFDLRLIPLSLLVLHDSPFSSPLTESRTKDKCLKNVAHDKIFVPILGHTRASIFLTKLNAETGSQWARIWPGYLYEFRDDSQCWKPNLQLPLQRLYVRDRLVIPANHIVTSRLAFFVCSEINRGSFVQGSWIDCAPEVDWIGGTQTHPIYISHVYQVRGSNNHPWKSRYYPGAGSESVIGIALGHDSKGRHCCSLSSSEPTSFIVDGIFFSRNNNDYGSPCFASSLSSLEHWRSKQFMYGNVHSWKAKGFTLSITLSRIFVNDRLVINVKGSILAQESVL